MSALPPKADVRPWSRNVRYVPQADIAAINDELYLLRITRVNDRGRDRRRTLGF
jgi:hypothetical protein